MKRSQALKITATDSKMTHCIRVDKEFPSFKKLSASDTNRLRASAAAKIADVSLMGLRLSVTVDFTLLVKHMFEDAIYSFVTVLKPKHRFFPISH